MRIDVSQRIGICYIDKEWRDKVMNEIYSKTPKEMISLIRNNEIIEFKDGSVIIAFKAEAARGRKFDKIFIQDGIPKEFVDGCLIPMIITKRVLSEQKDYTGEIFFL